MWRVEIFFVSWAELVTVWMKILWQQKNSFHCFWTWVAVSDEFMWMILFQKRTSCMRGTFLWIKIVIIFYKSAHSTLRSDTACYLWHILSFEKNFYEKLAIYWDQYAMDFLGMLYRRVKIPSCDLLLDFYISLASSTRQQHERDNFPSSKALICSIDPIIIIQFPFSVCVCALSVRRSLKIDVFMLS